MLIAAGIFAVIALVVLKRSTIVVPPRSAWMISRLGKPQRILNPGLHVLVPVVDAVAQKYSLDEQQVAVSETFRTSNDERLHVDAKVRYRILDPKTAFDKVMDIDNAVRASVSSAIRRETSLRTASFIRDDRRAFRDAIHSNADKIVSEFGTRITDLALEIPRGF